MPKQTGRKIYKWKAFGDQHVFVPKARGATTAAKAKSIARKQWKRKRFIPKRASKMDWGTVPGYVVAGNFKESGKKGKRARVKRVGRLVLEVR